MTMQLENQIYTQQQLDLLNFSKIPCHIAIIPDGNRRWAKQRGLSSLEGQRRGADTLMDAVKAAKEIGVSILTAYIFSTENWLRDPSEVTALLWLIQTYLESQCEMMIENGVKLDYIGDLNKLPERMQASLFEIKKATSHCSDIELILALNYGARNEIVRATENLFQDMQAGKISDTRISEKLLSKYLDTASWPDPDLLIRTSGEFRMSNFLLWQSWYAEFYKLDILWPDFSQEHLLAAILDYQSRERRKGGP
jgi:undecaprenyl diphosphate synthase